MKYFLDQKDPLNRSICILTNFTQCDEQLLFDSQLFDSETVESHAAVEHIDGVLLGYFALGILLDKSRQIVRS